MISPQRAETQRLKNEGAQSWVSVVNHLGDHGSNRSRKRQRAARISKTLARTRGRFAAEGADVFGADIDLGN